MLCIKSISVFQYKNYAQGTWDLDAKLIGIAGRNGTGKTNLLEAIYFCCFTKGYFSGSDAQLVQKGAQGMRLAAQFDKSGDPYEVTALIRESGKKEFRVNGALCERMADHIGQLPAVVVAPDDVEIIIAGSEERRRFMDALFSQIDHEYLLQLMTYNRLLQQRNSLLKQQAETGRRQPDLMDVLDQQLAAPANFVHQKRKDYLAQLIKGVVNRYLAISGESYQPELRYESGLDKAPFPTLLQQSRERDWLAQRTTMGIHRDDLGIYLDDGLFKQLASQGQRKSLLFALKMAAFDLLKVNKGFAPILLLDDVFEKLDEGRMQNLLQEVCVENDGQVLLTDTHPARINKSLERLSLNYRMISL